MKALNLMLLLLALTACGGDYKDPEEAVGSGKEIQFGSQKVRVVSGSLNVVSGSIQGSGGLIFDSRYEEFKSGGSYGVDFSIDDGGSLTVVSHSNESLASGFELEFRREGASLKATLRAQGNSWSATNQFAAVNAAGVVRLQMDVHNDESPAHVVVWDQTASGDDFSENRAILKSNEEVDGSPGIGTGTRWGLKLNKATITRAERSEPKFQH